MDDLLFDLVSCVIQLAWDFDLHKVLWRWMKRRREAKLLRTSRRGGFGQRRPTVAGLMARRP